MVNYDISHDNLYDYGVDGRQTEKDRQKKVLEAHRAQDQPELARLQELLGWRVEGTKSEFMKAQFREGYPAGV